MVRMLRIALVLALMGIAGWANEKKPDFTGDWELNIAKSNFGKMPKPSRMTLKSEYKGDVMHATETTYDQEGHRTVAGDWFLDGKEHPLAEFGPGKSVTKWVGDTLVNERRSDNGHYRQSDRLSLSKDGKVATERVHTKNPNAENNSVLVWEKR